MQSSLGRDEMSGTDRAAGVNAEMAKDTRFEMRASSVLLSQLDEVALEEGVRRRVRTPSRATMIALLIVRAHRGLGLAPAKASTRPVSVASGTPRPSTPARVEEEPLEEEPLEEDEDDGDYESPRYDVMSPEVEAMIKESGILG